MRKLITVVLLITLFAVNSINFDVAAYSAPTSGIMFGDDLCFEDANGNCITPGGGGGTTTPPSYTLSKGDVVLSDFHIIKSPTRHAGMGINSYDLVEAMSGGVQINTLNSWKTRYNGYSILKVSVYWSSERTAAVDYALDQLGEPYNILASRDDTHQWYCSHLVWKAYKLQGYDIESTWPQQGVGLITPGDLEESPLTYQVDNWDK